ncbi:uncharacterized protein LOC124641544 [Helicoverpa zea]|uniref:uncharacterized protein LOC124641544 n=1 Tax=Helicoverpa zea TaxID=7113 RepID=UPI001F562C16|nr:uncharacterized protein LOC124641544 [Helicoverpa zea]
MFPSKCVIFVFSSVIVACFSKNDSDTDGKVIKTFPYRFSFYDLDRLNMNVTLKNIPPNVTSAFLKMQLPRRKLSRDFKIGRGGNSVQIQRQFEEEKIVSIDLELYDSVGPKRVIRLCEGKQAFLNISSITKLIEYKPGGPCFQESESCMLEIDLGYKETLSTVELIIIPCSVILMLVLILQAIEAIRKHCRKKPDIANRPPMPLPHHPFYLNLLFQKECEREIQEKEGQLCEENIYEEIDSY